MLDIGGSDLWNDGDLYEAYTGRWSRKIAGPFLEWISVKESSVWCDACCGTGALTHGILSRCNPQRVDAVDLSLPYLTYAKDHVSDPRVTFSLEDIEHLSKDSDSYDVVVSGLAINFLQNPQAAADQFFRVLRKGGTAAAYVWDFAEGMEMIRIFWDAARVSDPDCRDLDPANRYPLCKPDALRSLLTESGFSKVDITSIVIDTDFEDFESYWNSFETRQGTAPQYLASLTEIGRERLRKALHEKAIARSNKNLIHLTARAWAVKGVK